MSFIMLNFCVRFFVLNYQWKKPEQLILSAVALFSLANARRNCETAEFQFHNNEKCSFCSRLTFFNLFCTFQFYGHRRSGNALLKTFSLFFVYFSSFFFLANSKRKTINFLALKNLWTKKLWLTTAFIKWWSSNTFKINRKSTIKYVVWNVLCSM